MSNDGKELVSYSSEMSIFYDETLFNHARRATKILTESNMIPQLFRGNAGPANALIAFEVAHRAGLSVWFVMKEMSSIRDKVGISGKVMVAMFNKCKEYGPIRYETRGDVSSPKDDNDGRRAFAKHIASNEIVYGPWVTWKTVKDSGWYGRSGSKWKEIPDLMFMYRAAEFFINSQAPHVIFGMYTNESIEDMSYVQDAEYSTYNHAPDKDSEASPGDYAVKEIHYDNTSQQEKTKQEKPKQPKQEPQINSTPKNKNSKPNTDATKKTPPKNSNKNSTQECAKEIRERYFELIETYGESEVSKVAEKAGMKIPPEDERSMNQLFDMMLALT